MRTEEEVRIDEESAEAWSAHGPHSAPRPSG